MAQARRCPIGCETWPDDEMYARCPVCWQDTERFSNGRPLSDEDAFSVKLHYDFEVFYVNHCEERGQPVDGPLPFEEEVECVTEFT